MSSSEAAPSPFGSRTTTKNACRSPYSSARAHSAVLAMNRRLAEFLTSSRRACASVPASDARIVMAAPRSLAVAGRYASVEAFRVNLDVAASQECHFAGSFDDQVTPTFVPSAPSPALIDATRAAVIAGSAPTLRTSGPPRAAPAIGKNRLARDA
jgi:hypothetical protein